MTNDGRELRRDSDLGVAPGHGRRGQTVTAEGRKSSARRTSRSRWREVDFRFEGHHELRGLEQILKQHLAGPNWLAKERRLCNFSVSDATLRLSWQEQCSPAARRPATKKRSRTNTKMNAVTDLQR